MTPFEIGLIALALMGLLVFLGMYVPIALISCSFVGVWAIKGSLSSPQRCWDSRQMMRSHPISLGLYRSSS